MITGIKVMRGGVVELLAYHQAVGSESFTVETYPLRVAEVVEVVIDDLTGSAQVERVVVESDGRGALVTLKLLDEASVGAVECYALIGLPMSFNVTWMRDQYVLLIGVHQRESTP